MNLQKFIYFLFLVVTTASTKLHASVTLIFSQTGTARATGFGNKDGVAADNMNWGIIISTSNSQFSAGSYDVFDVTQSGFLKINGVLTDDYYVAQPLLTSTLGETGGDPGGAGGITAISEVPFGSNGISVNDPFALIWFDMAPSPSSYYGVLQNAAFVVPTDGSNQSYADVFLGADPIKTASFQFAAIPEPSRAILLSLGVFAFLIRRKGKV